MDEGEFEWNAGKAESNLVKQGVSFEAARRVFDDAFAFERCDFDSARRRDPIRHHGHGQRRYSDGGLYGARRPHTRRLRKKSNQA
jgi:uncharacterized DUF497 family protein